MGRAFRIVKRTTHLTVEVTERPQVIKAIGDEAGGQKRSAAKATAKPSRSKSEKAKE